MNDSRFGLIFAVSLLACTSAPESSPLPEPVASAPPPAAAAAESPVPIPVRKAKEQVTLRATWAQFDGAERPQLVAHLEPIPEWHIYWAHPGEAGLPTRFHLERDAAQLDHRTQMPLPKRLTSPGDIVTYGYEGETHFFIDSDQAGSGGAFTLRADWLACKEVCIKGKATVRVPGAPAKGLPAPQAMQKDWDERPKAKAVKWQKEGPAWVLEMPTAQRLELYPHSNFQLALDQTRPPYCKGNRCRIKLPPSAFQEQTALAYTLRVENKNTTQGFEADFLEGTQP